MAFQRPTAGELDTRVELQDKASAASGTSGLTNTYPVTATVWARMRTLYGGRVVAGEQVDERATHNFVIRYRAGYVDGSESWDHLEMGRTGARRRFRVLSCGDPEGNRGEWLEILAEELRRGV